MGLGSRIREKSTRLFHLFAEVVGPSDDGDGWILQKFPDDYNEIDVMKAIPNFCFPTGTCSPGPVQQFCFVITDAESQFRFGFCRLSTEGKHCLCILSNLPWHDLFYKMLNYIMELMTKNPSDDSIGFLRTAYGTPVPDGGEELHVIYKLQKVEFQAYCPDMKKLPTIPESRAITEFYNALDINCMIAIFARNYAPSLLNERRVIITSNKLGRLTACVMACNAILYPMHWQWIFITVLPKKMLDHVSAPMPYIIGVPGELLPAVMEMDLGEVVIVDCDKKTVSTPHKDVQELPSAVVSLIRNASGNMFGDGVARAFMRALVELIGGYRFGLSFPPGEKISFDTEKFIRNRPPVYQPFLIKLVDHQLFRQFIDERLDLLNKGEGFNDEFEQEVSLLIDQDNDVSERASIVAQYRRWSTKSGNYLKSVTSKMKDRGKEAVKGFRAKMQDVNIKDNFTISDGFSPHETNGSASNSPVPLRLQRFTNKSPSGSLKTSSVYLGEEYRVSVAPVPNLDDDALSLSDKSIASSSTPEKSRSQQLPQPPDILTAELPLEAPASGSLIDLDDETDKRQQKAKDIMHLVNQIQNPVMNSGHRVLIRTLPVRPNAPNYNPSFTVPFRPPISLDAINSRRSTLIPATRYPPPQQTRSVFYDSFPANISGYAANPRFVSPAGTTSPTFYTTLRGPGAVVAVRSNVNGAANIENGQLTKQPVQIHSQNQVKSTWENFEK